MTEKQFEKRVRDWQKVLQLDRWVLTIDFDQPAVDGAHASTWRSNQYETATLHLDPEWRKWSSEEAEQHIVHELVHLFTRDFEEVWKMLDSQLPHGPDKAVEAAFDFRLEQLVDVIARRFIAVRGC